MATQKQLLIAAKILGISGLNTDSTEEEIWRKINAKNDQSDRPQETTSTEVAAPIDREGRLPRSHQDREVSTRESDAWVPASILPSPIKQDGWEFRWVRTAMLGQSDLANVSRKFRESWVPVKAADHKELSVMSDLDSRFSENVEIGGLLLCKAPTEEVEKRRKHYDKVNAQQLESVDQNYMKESDPRSPLLKPERESRTSFGRD